MLSRRRTIRHGSTIASARNADVCIRTHARTHPRVLPPGMHGSRTVKLIIFLTLLCPSLQETITASRWHAPPVYKSPYLEIKVWSPYTCLGPHDAKTLGCFVMHVSSMSQVDPPWAAKARILVPLSALVLFRAPGDLFRLRPRSEYVFLAC